MKLFEDVLIIDPSDFYKGFERIKGFERLCSRTINTLFLPSYLKEEDYIYTDWFACIAGSSKKLAVHLYS